MPKTRASTKVLSRFFDSNAQLVAGVCSNCYGEEEDVKIVAVNRKFLRDAEARKKLTHTITDYSSLHFDHCLPHDDNAAATQQTFDRCQSDPLKLPPTTSNDCALIASDNASPSHDKIKLRSNFNYRCKETRNDYAASEIHDGNDSKDKFQKIPTKLINFDNLKKTDIKSQQTLSVKLNLDLMHLTTTKKENFLGLNFTKLKIEDDSLTEIKTEPSDFHGESKHFQATTAKLNLKKLRSIKVPLWNPPQSPHNLIEEALFHDPWALLVATIFLNRTACMCARPRVEEFLKDFVDPWEVLDKKPPELEKYFVGLGLHRRRAIQVWRMSHDFVHKSWRNPKELYGIGKYGEDAYRIFILGDLNIEPTDRFLRIYRDWARMKENEEKMKKPLTDS